MPQNKTVKILISFLILLLLVAFLLTQNSLRRSTHIVLPDITKTPIEGNLDADSGKLELLEVTAETVQSVIATLHRPERYRRTLTTETFWSGGSGTMQVNVAVEEPYTRTDTGAATGQLRHAITDGETTYIWYGNSKNYYTALAGDITADDEQHIPTYEDILQLPTETIALADYRALNHLPCIFVETAADKGGYVDRYWVSVDSGLLLGAETLQDGETVYRMTALAAEGAPPTAEDFTLPDGTKLRP